MKLPCEIVRDLMPSYVDGLTAPVTSEAVEEHMKECEVCRTLCNTMRSPCETALADEDKNLFAALHRRFSRKTRRIAAAAVCAVVLAGTGIWAGFSLPLRPIPVEALSVQADVYPVAAYASGESEDGSVTISMFSNDAETGKAVSFPKYNIAFTCSEELLGENSYATAIRIESDYVIRAVDADRIEEDGKAVYLLSDARTSLLGGKTAAKSSQVTLEFAAVDEIRCVDSEGNQTTLWTRPANE